MSLDPFAMLPERFLDALVAGRINRRQFAIGAHLVRRADCGSGRAEGVTVAELLLACGKASRGEGQPSAQTIRNDLRHLARLDFIEYEPRQGVGEYGVLLTGLWVAHRPRDFKESAAHFKEIGPDNFEVTSKARQRGHQANPLAEPERGAGDFKDAAAPRCRDRQQQGGASSGKAKRPRGAASAYVAANGWPTGSRFARGSHSGQFVQDPLGHDRPPHPVPWDKPSLAEIERALRERGAA